MKILFVLVISCLLSLINYAGAESSSLSALEGSLKISKVFQPSLGRVTLSNGAVRYTAIVRQTGEFAFGDLSAGTYTLEASHPQFSFAPIRVDVPKSDSTPSRAVVLFPLTSSRRDRLSPPLSLRAENSIPLRYFAVPEPYQWTSLLKNPMLIMIFVGLAMAACMPKMMENLSAEEKEKLNEDMKKYHPLSWAQKAAQSASASATSSSNGERKRQIRTE